MLASFPASMLNQKPSDLGIPNRFKLDPSRSREEMEALAFIAIRRSDAGSFLDDGIDRSLIF